MVRQILTAPAPTISLCGHYIRGKKLGKNSFSFDLGKKPVGMTSLGGAQAVQRQGSKLKPFKSGKKATADVPSAEDLEYLLLYKELLLAQVNNEAKNIRRLAQKGVDDYPKQTRFHIQLAASLNTDGEYMEALTHLTNALALEPQNSEILVAIGNTLDLWGKPNDAKGFYDAAFRVDANNVPAISNLINLSMKECDWSFYPQLPTMLENLGKAKAIGNPFNLLSVADDPEFSKTHLVRRDRSLQKNVVKNHRFKPQAKSGDKIRIGYFSSDFYKHATMFLLGKFFENHDPNRFEVRVYDLQAPVDTEEGRNVRASFDSYTSLVGLTDKEAAERACADGLDIAVDMKGFTKGCRPMIFAHRVAPIQVSYLGYPGTMGVSNMDYFLGDPVTVPKGKRRFFSEKIMYMPHCYQVNDNTRPHPETLPTRPELGLPEDRFVFCSFNNPNKITPVEYDIWMRLLQRVPESVLWILAPTTIIRENLTREAAARGIGPERLVFAPRVSNDAHLARLPQADLFLDTFNCCAHTTASETLWSGVPLITKPGDQFASRVAASILTAIGCDDLITQSEDAYFDLAVKLAQDPAALADIKQRLKDNLWTTPLYDSQAYVEDYQNLMELAVKRQEAGKTPAHLFLPQKEH